MTKQFVIGKTYRHTDPTNTSSAVEFTTADNTFICTGIEDRGQACSVGDVTFHGEPDPEDGVGWVVASPSELDDGTVVEV